MKDLVTASISRGKQKIHVNGLAFEHRTEVSLTVSKKKVILGCVDCFILASRK